MALKLEIAQEALLKVVQVTAKEVISLEQCWQRVLAETITADMDFPPFDRSPLDGYAVIASDIAQATPEEPVILRQIDNVPAGSLAHETVISGTACRIMTGAPIPQGATGVVRLEDTLLEGDQVKVLMGYDAHKNICPRGEEIAVGEELIAAGTLLNAGAMGLLAVLGKDRPYVFRKPRVAIIATGTEIVPINTPLTPGKIRNSNSYMLSAQVQEAGALPVFLGTAKDDVDEIVQLISTVPECDVVITTGGASVGDYDFIGEVFQRLEIPILFDRINIKPGMPVVAGVKNGKHYIGLSGNPSAASIAFEQLVRPVLIKMSGRTNWWRPTVRAVLTAPFKKSIGAKRFVWSRCWQDGEGLLVEPLRLQGNGMLQSAVNANSLMVIPENSPPLLAGTELEVILLTNI
ncbi:MAG TPA: gephyrin-like molybdotransferase Glp [Negativicutes bacterium]|jgi:molybdopterin molybdotransferase